MPNYQNSKIYKIWSPSCTEIYIGATTRPLHQRFGKHKTMYKKFLEGKTIGTTSREILKYDDAKIELVVKCPCNDREELNKIEGDYIRKYNCVNKYIPDRTRTQYYQDNKELIIEKKKIYYEKNKPEILEQAKLYYEDNKQKIAERKKIYHEKNKSEIIKKKKIHYEKNKQKISKYQKKYYEKNKEKLTEKIECICGSTISRSSKYNHERSNKHKNFLVESDK